MEQLNKKRDLSFDIVRTLCIIEIIGFWHLLDYINPSLYNSNADILEYYGGIITQGVLATFTLMSSIFLGRYEISNIGEISTFIRKRLKRFFPLFFLSSLFLFVASTAVGECWYKDFVNFVNSLFGITNFCPPQPPTMWYMSMLIFLYLITPFILIKKGWKRFIIATFIYMAILIASTTFEIDYRLLLYMPVYLIGLIISKDYWDKIKRNRFILLLSLSVVFVEIVKNPFSTIIDRRHFLILFAMPVFIISISSFMESKYVNKISSFISYSSMSMYLFHRHIFLLFVFLFGVNETSSLRNAYLPIWVLYVIILPIIIVSSYIIQKTYDNLLKKLNNNKFK